MISISVILLGEFYSSEHSITLLSYRGDIVSQHIEANLPETSEARVPPLKMNVEYCAHISSQLLWKLNEDKCPWHLHVALDEQDKRLLHEPSPEHTL